MIQRKVEAVTLGAHVLDILGRYVTHIPEGQGSILLDEIRLAPAGSAAGGGARFGAGHGKRHPAPGDLLRRVRAARPGLDQSS